MGEKGEGSGGEGGEGVGNWGKGGGNWELGTPLSTPSDIVLIFCHILVLQEYWVLTESRIQLKPRETQSNRVCCFLIL